MLELEKFRGDHLFYIDSVGDMHAEPIQLGLCPGTRAADDGRRSQ